MKLYKIATRSQLSFNDLRKIEKLEQYIIENTIDNETIEQVEIHFKHAGYTEK